MTKEAFESDVAGLSMSGRELSVITPVSQLESYSLIMTTVAAECACAKCLQRPEGQRHIISLLQMFVSVDGLDIVRANFPNAQVIAIDTPPDITIPCPLYGALPGLKCDPATRPTGTSLPQHVM